MADAPAGGQSKGGTFGFLTRKIGPAPVWLWAGLAFGGYYWYTHYGPGAQQQQPAAAPAAAGAGRGGGTGPAGPAGPPGPAGKDDRDRRREHGRPPRGGEPPPRGRKPPPMPPRGRNAPAAQPQQATAPMTAGGIYGTTPVATANGTTYDSGDPNTVLESGGPHGAELEGAYVPAG